MPRHNKRGSISGSRSGSGSGSGSGSRSVEFNPLDPFLISYPKLIFKVSLEVKTRQRLFCKVSARHKDFNSKLGNTETQTCSDIICNFQQEFVVNFVVGYEGAQFIQVEIVEGNEHGFLNGRVLSIVKFGFTEIINATNRFPILLGGSDLIGYLTITSTVEEEPVTIDFRNPNMFTRTFRCGEVPTVENLREEYPYFFEDVTLYNFIVDCPKLYGIKEDRNSTRNCHLKLCTYDSATRTGGKTPLSRDLESFYFSRAIVKTPFTLKASDIQVSYLQLTGNEDQSAPVSASRLMVAQVGYMLVVSSLNLNFNLTFILTFTMITLHVPLNDEQCTT